MEENQVFRLPRVDVLPLYEAKMIHQFDPRLSTYEGVDDEVQA